MVGAMLAVLFGCGGDGGSRMEDTMMVPADDDTMMPADDEFLPTDPQAVAAMASSRPSISNYRI